MAFSHPLTAYDWFLAPNSLRNLRMLSRPARLRVQQIAAAGYRFD
jgi:hypothetical protein